MSMDEDKKRVLFYLSDGSFSQGEHIRSYLNFDKWFWNRYSARSFYRMMVELEESGFIELIPVSGVSADWYRYRLIKKCS
jgi:hypothetical protein